MPENSGLTAGDSSATSSPMSLISGADRAAKGHLSSPAPIASGLPNKSFIISDIVAT